jgi:hypothetical protein
MKATTMAKVSTTVKVTVTTTVKTVDHSLHQYLYLQLAQQTN